MRKKPKTDVLEGKASEIIESYEAGMSLDNLAPKFNVNPSTIRRFLLDHDVKLRPAVRPCILEKSKKQVIGFYKEGWSTKKLAQRFHVDRNTVSIFLYRLGLLRNVPLSERQFFIKNDIDRGILAGLILGEGCIVIRGKTARITISNQDSAIMGWLSKFGGRIHWSKPRKNAINPCAVWNLSRSVDVFHCLSNVLPLLFGKKKNLAIAALNVLKTSYGFQEIDPK